MAPKTPLDDMLLALADRHRRRILLALLEGDSLAVDDVVVPPDDGAGEDYLKRHQIRLLHNHLPHLNDAGLVRWNPGAGTVERGPRFDEVRSLLELLDGHKAALPARMR